MQVTLKVVEVYRTEHGADVHLADGEGKILHLKLTLEDSRGFEPGELFKFTIEPVG